jgi:hypothetical protein
MAVTLFFRNGQICEFSAGVAVEKRDGFVRVLRYGSQPPAFESVAAFKSTDVALAQAYQHGTLVEVVEGDRPAA